MFKLSIRHGFISLVLASVVGAPVAAQTSLTTPSNPAQRDATRPPGTEQRQPLPAGARPNTQDPTAPPGVQRPAPRTPPGTSTDAPQAATPQTTTTTTTPGRTTDATNRTAVDAASGGEATPALPGLQQRRPVPPLPRLTRLGVTGGATLPLTLNETIRRALENNNDIDFSRNDVRFAETTLTSLESVYDPVFFISPQIVNSVQPSSNVLAGSDNSGTVTTTDLNFNQSMVKMFRRGGGRYEFFFNNTRETSSSSNSQLSPFYSANFGVEFTQPLLRNRSIDTNRRAIRVQRKLLSQTDADFRRRVMDVIAQVERAYWDLAFALRDQQNRIENLKLARELFSQTEGRIEAGSVAPLERAEVQTELSSRESELLAATKNVTLAENTLKQLILRDPLAREWSAALVPTDEPTFDDAPVNLEDALAEARSTRPELTRLRLQQDISDIDIEYFKDQMRPRVDIAATVSTTGLAGNPVRSSQSANIPRHLVGGYGQTLRNLAGFSTRNIVVGVSIEIPFRNRRAQAELAGARIQREQMMSSLRSQEQAIEVEVRNTAQSVETARQRVLTARAARESAELQLEGERRLYEVGRSTTFLLFQRENQLTTARNLELRAQTDYNKERASLQRAISSTLRANNVIIELPDGR